MLYQFLLNFVDIFGFLNVFKYLTFRTGLSVFTSLLIVLIIGGPFIKFLLKEARCYLYLINLQNLKKEEF